MLETELIGFLGDMRPSENATLFSPLEASPEAKRLSAVDDASFEFGLDSNYVICMYLRLCVAGQHNCILNVKWLLL